MPEEIDKRFESEQFKKDIEHIGERVGEILEKEPAVHEETAKAAIREAIKPKVYPPSPAGADDKTLPAYAKDAPEDAKQEAHRLADLVFSQGLDKTVSQARQAEPFVLDVFHDALVDRLYEELKKRNIIK